MARWQQIEVLTQGRQVITESWKHDLKRHYWRCYLNLDAGAQLIVGQQTIRSDPGSFYLIPPYQNIRSDCSGAVRHNFFHFMLSSEGGSRVAMPNQTGGANHRESDHHRTGLARQRSRRPALSTPRQQVISAIIIAYLQENPSAKTNGLRRKTTASGATSHSRHRRTAPSAMYQRRIAAALIERQITSGKYLKTSKTNPG